MVKVVSTNDITFKYKISSSLEKAEFKKDRIYKGDNKKW